jgi:glyoxylase-like metal-dependent hydrolase (beta-lactamase superfamily II)
VRLKHAFLHARQDWRRRVDLFLPGAWSAPVPIHCWAVEHHDRLVLVDAGETAGARDIAFARFDVRPDQELPAALAGAGLSSADVTDVVLTHMHGDHMDGAVHVRGPVLVHDLELTFSRSRRARLSQRVLRQPLPADVDFRPFPLDGGRFGAFGRSRALTDDGRVIAVDTAGHTAGHVSVICVDDDDRHILLAGDATDTLEQLREVRADAIAPKPAVSRTTMRTILAHAQEHPTVYLPSHDPESIARLQEARTL